MHSEKITLQTRPAARTAWRVFFVFFCLSLLPTVAIAGTLTCTVATTCSGGTVLFRLSGTANAHAELPSQSLYSQLVCCTGVSGLGNSCSGTFAVVAKLAKITNSHLEEGTQSNYSNSACISVSSGSVSVGYQANNCAGYDTTIASLSSVTNAHGGDSGAYTTKICATASSSTTPPPPPPPPPSGGGGAAPTVTSSIGFSGRAYPGSTVTLLKDAQVVVETVAGPDSLFQISLGGLEPGNYTFALYSSDKLGNRSSLSTFPVSLAGNATTAISGVFLAPTISVDKTEVKRGDNIAIFGQSVAAGEVSIQVHSATELFFKTKTDTKGAYLYNLDTSVLEEGQHTTKSKAAIAGEVSTFSQSINFKVGDNSVLVTPITEGIIGDLNKDGRVNLIDYSIMAYWYKRSSPPDYVDLNHDGKITLTDFSILAYYWTG